MQLKLSTNVKGQLALLALHAVNQIIDQTTAKPYVMIVLAMLQGALALVAHQYNPDGTPAEAPYRPELAAKSKAAGGA